MTLENLLKLLKLSDPSTKTLANRKFCIDLSDYFVKQHPLVMFLTTLITHISIHVIKSFVKSNYRSVLFN